MKLPKIKWTKLAIFGGIGMALGYAYYFFIGCNSGACPLTSNPFITRGYGLGAGLLLGFDLDKNLKADNE